MNFLVKLRNSKVAKNGLSAYFCQASTLVTGVVTIPVMVHYLSIEEIAIWVLASSLSSYMSLFDLGIGDAIARKIAGAIAEEDQIEINRWWSVTNFILICITILILAVGLAVTPWFGDFVGVSESVKHTANQVFAAMVIITALSVLNRGIPGILVAQERTHLPLIAQAGASWLNLVVVVLLLWRGFGLFACVAGYAFRMLTIWLSYHWLLRRGPRPPRWDSRGVNFARVKSLFSFSVSFSCTVLVDLAVSAIPPLALAWFGSAIGVPALAVSARAPTLLANVANRTVWAFYPGMLRLQLAGNASQMLEKHKRASLLGFAVSLFVAGGIVAFNRGFVTIVAGEEFYVGSLANAVLAMIVIVTPTSHLFRCFLTLGGSMGHVASISLLSTVFALLVSWGLFPQWGLVGLLLPMFLPVTCLAIYGWLHGVKSCGITRSEVSVVGAVLAVGTCVLLIVPALLELVGFRSVTYFCAFGREVPLPSLAEMLLFLGCCGVSLWIGFILVRDLRAGSRPLQSQADLNAYDS